MIQLNSIYNPLFLDDEKFIILITGGRGSGKSFAASTFIERLTFEYNNVERISHKILYTRYTMTSAHISVIPEFTEKIDFDGTGEFFRATKTDVVNTMTGAEVMFRGIHTSSGNQTAKLKSIHGVTTFVVDEGEEWLSYEEYEKIMLSIRQKGLRNRVIIIMNPADSNHFVYEKYIKDTHKLVEYDGVQVQISTHPNVLHIHTSYLDNLEHLSEDFLKAAREMKENDPERYAHVFMGRWDDVAEGAVYKKFGVVDEFPEYCECQGLGMDFGYFPDPSAVVRCGVIGKRMYWDEVAYGQGWHAPQAAEALNEYPDLFTYAENADERFAKDISNLGPIVYRVEKGPGSIMAGINGIQEYELYITKRSVHLEHEMRNYVWAKDIYGNYCNLPEDHDNHCFVAGTMVRTPEGEKPIETLVEGDWVMTSKGKRRVTKFFDNGEKQVVRAKIYTDNKVIELVATPDHKIKTPKGWKQLKDLTQGDVVYTFNPSMEKTISSIQERSTFQKDAQDSIGRSGNTIMGQSLKGIMFTTRTRIHGIMTSLTLSASKAMNTLANICRSTSQTQSFLSKQESDLTTHESLQKNGIGQKMGELGIANTVKKSQRIFPWLSVRVSGVGQSMRPKTQKAQDFALTNVNMQQDSTQGLIMRQECASNVEKSSRLTSITRTSSAQEAVPQHTEICSAQSVQKIEMISEGLHHVYDIEVEELHEFFASNLLVHNCIDACRYWYRGRIQGKILKPRATTKEQLGIF